jgi:uncharacterized phage protein gp47/JayE
MAFQRPTLNELVDRVQQDFVSRLGLAGAVLRRSVVHILARVVAGAAHMLHGHLEYLSRQIFPDRSEAEFLERQASLFGITRRAAQFATGSVDVAGTSGIVVAAGTVLLRSDGARYETDAEVMLIGGSATPAVTAVDAGEAGNADAGTALTFESPIEGINSRAAVGVGGLVNGSDPESDDSLRARLLERMRRPPHGGAAADYVAWALEVPGVTRAWVYPLELGAGTVTVRFVRDDDASPIPGAAEVAAVQAYIEERRPVTAAVAVLAPVGEPLDLTLSIAPDTAATRAAVEAEVADFLRRTAEPGGTVPVSQLRMAIGSAEGLTDFDLQSPAADVTSGTGELATPGTITWA